MTLTAKEYDRRLMSLNREYYRLQDYLYRLETRRVVLESKQKVVADSMFTLSAARAAGTI